MSTTQPEAPGAQTPAARAKFEVISRFCGCEWSLDWDAAGFYSDAQADAAFIWFEQGFQCTNPASAQAGEPAKPSPTAGECDVLPMAPSAQTAPVDAVVQQDAEECDVPPFGWRCTRAKGHEGPCAAVEAPEDKAFVDRGMQRLRDAEDAARMNWLAEQYIGPNFQWGDPATEVVVIEMPKGGGYCGDFRKDIDAARAAKVGA